MWRVWHGAGVPLDVVLEFRSLGAGVPLTWCWSSAHLVLEFRWNSPSKPIHPLYFLGFRSPTRNGILFRYLLDTHGSLCVKSKNFKNPANGDDNPIRTPRGDSQKQNSLRSHPGGIEH